MTSIWTGLGLATAAGIITWLYPRYLSPNRQPLEAEPERHIALREIPKLFRAITAARVDGSYAAISAPRTTGYESAEAACIQFSMERGRPGIDWILESRQGLADQPRFEREVAAFGSEVDAREMNGAPYLRVERGDLPAIAVSILERLYGVRAGDSLRLEVEGFDWP